MLYLAHTHTNCCDNAKLYQLQWKEKSAHIINVLEELIKYKEPLTAVLRH